jgi:predicted HTH transcriptional regulator
MTIDARTISDEEADIILKYEEDHFRDVKGRVIAPAKLSRSISAFANTAGGELFIGIEEREENGSRYESGTDSRIRRRPRASTSSSLLFIQAPSSAHRGCSVLNRPGFVGGSNS